MKITKVEATAHNIPIEVPLLPDKRWQSLIFCRVETDEGITGYGLTNAFMQYPSVLELINGQAAEILTDMNPIETERIGQTLFNQLNMRSHTGVWSLAVSAIDIALWDIKGKYFKEPVWRLLGGARSKVPAYITFGLHAYSREQLAEVASSFVEEGQDKLKMVVAINNAEDTVEDAARVRTLREAVGDKIQLMIDANNHFSLNAALDLCRRVEEYGISWFEEPLYGNDALLMANLRRRTTIPLSAGQNEGSIFRHRELLLNGAVDILQPNVCWVGGFTEGQKVAAMAQSFNIPIANGGGMPHHNMHLQAAMSNGWRVEFHYLMWKAEEIVYINPPGPIRGWVELTEEPGLGLDPNFEALDEYEYGKD